MALLQQSWISKLKRSRWLVLVVSCWIDTLNASVNLYSSYSQAMKTSLQLDQKNLTMVSSSSGVGNSLGIVAGYLYTYLPHWVLILAAVAMQSFGFFMIWLAIAYKIHGQVWQLCIYEFLIGGSQACIQTVTIVTSMKEFPSKGGVIGLLKGFNVLGASILLQIFSLFYGSDETKLPWMMFLLLPSMILVMPAVRSLPNSATPLYKVQTNMFILSACLTGLATFLLLIDILEVFVAFSRLVRLLVCLIIFSFFLSLLIPVLSEIHNKEVEHEQEPLLPPSSTIDLMTNIIDLSLAQILASLDFWLLFIALVLGFGSTRTISANIAQFANSLGYTQNMATICVSLFCVSSCWGRIGFGLLSDHCFEKYATPKSVFLMLAMITTSVGTALAAVPVPGALMIVTILGGLSDGAHWCLSTAVACDLFGMRTLSIVFNILYLSNPAGTYILSSRVVGYFYDLNAEEGSILCYGGSCFRVGYAVVSAASVMAAVLVAILARRSQTKSEQCL